MIYSIESIFGSGATEQAESQAVEQQASVLILIPLVLGIGKVGVFYTVHRRCPSQHFKWL